MLNRERAELSGSHKRCSASSSAGSELAAYLICEEAGLTRTRQIQPLDQSRARNFRELERCSTLCDWRLHMRGRARRSAGAEPTAYGNNAEPCEQSSYEQSSYEQSSHERGSTSNAAGAELAACSSIAQSCV